MAGLDAPKLRNQPSIDAQIAAVKSAKARTESKTERACLDEAVRTLIEVKAERSRGQIAVAALSDAIRRTR